MGGTRNGGALQLVSRVHSSRFYSRSGKCLNEIPSFGRVKGFPDAGRTRFGDEGGFPSAHRRGIAVAFSRVSFAT